MKDKITFGNFIRSKRKESGLSQKELAEKLYVTESAVSKWERGISYPDITMISGICEALNISEHELCNASEDENQRKIERMAEKYKKFIIIYNAVLILGYLSALIPCFIVFVIKEHMPSKFFILLTSLMMTASVLNVPVIADKNKALISFGSFYLSLNLLFLSGSIYSGTHWFLMAFLSVLTGICIVFLPFILRSDLISGYMGKNKALVCMTADTVSIMLTVIYGTRRYGSIADMCDGIFISIWGLSLAWIIFAVFRYVKINVFFRISISFLVSALYVFFANTMISLSGISGEITIISSDPYNIKVSLALAVIAVISAFFGMIFKFKRRNFLDKPIFDSWDLEYKNPFGAITRESEFRFRIRIPKDIHLDYPPGVVLFRNGFKERFLNMTKICEEKDCNVYQASFYARYSGAHYYYFSYTSYGTRHYIKKTDGHLGNIDNGDLFQLTVYAPFYETPDFLKGGIMYQIFPDRFCKSGKEHENIPYGRVLRDDWGGTPYYKPDERGHVWNNDYFGGDLEGIRSKLDYLSDLGVTCIYLNPIFESHENHRYNTANYMKIDPLLGTEEDFKNLCEDAKSRGISVILDGVFSHTGADSIYFNKFNRYDTVGAYNSKDSEYYDWYTFYNYPNEYEAWWGIDTLPNVHEMNPDYLEYICGKDGVLNHWLNLGASGWRLDVADELPEDFIIKLRETVKENDKEKIVIGEVWEDASNKEAYGVKRLYLNGKQLDSVMNYPFREAIIGYIKGGEPNWFRNSIMTILENYPKCTVDVLMNFVSTHDIERAINRFAGESCDGKSKDWMAERYLNESEYTQGKNMLKSAMVLQFFLPGVPSIYYGDEAGLQGYKDPFNRRCYPWGNEDTELIAYTKEIGKIRRSIPAFVDGKMKFIYTDNDVMIFERYNDSSRAVIFMNRYGNERTVENLSSMIENYSQLEVTRGNIAENKVTLEPYGYAVMSYTEPQTETESESE